MARDSPPGHARPPCSENTGAGTGTRQNSASPDLTQQFQAIHPALRVEGGILREQIHNQLRQERILALLSGFFGGLALLLASIGLYGTLSYV